MRCDFCNEQKSLESIYFKIYGNVERKIFETDNFLVYPCMGQLREGHLLVVSKRHINAIGMLDEIEFSELDHIIQKISAFLRKEYDLETLCFEHGVLSDNGQNGGCGISHLHLHLVPINRKEYELLCNQLNTVPDFSVKSINGLIETKKCIEEGKTYILFAKISNGIYDNMTIINCKRNSFESQYMRKTFCTVIRKKEWNWKDIEYIEDEFINTLKKAKYYFDFKD